MRHFRPALLVAFLLLILPSAFPSRHGFGGVRTAYAATSSCTPAAPTISSDNTWAWASWGSWGLPGQQLTYVIKVTNNDVGCSSSTFVVNVSAPNGFSVSLPTNTISLKAPSAGYLSAYVTSPSALADGDNPLTLTVERAGTSTPSSSFTTYYKVYSSDTVAPTLFWPNPSDGMAISGRSYSVTVSSNDDHEVKKIDLYIDNVYRSTSVCQDIAYNCQLSYTWSLRGVQGQHTVTYKSYDWMWNVGVMTATFTVG